eukprot:scaffold293298_cov47-Attheya_sp.AAC.1
MGGGIANAKAGREGRGSPKFNNSVGFHGESERHPETETRANTVVAKLKFSNAPKETNDPIRRQN